MSNDCLGLLRTVDLDFSVMDLNPDPGWKGSIEINHRLKIMYKRTIMNQRVFDSDGFYILGLHDSVVDAVSALDHRIRYFLEVLGILQHLLDG
jgi:hypothetical protein